MRLALINEQEKCKIIKAELENTKFNYDSKIEEIVQRK